MGVGMRAHHVRSKFADVIQFAHPTRRLIFIESSQSYFKYHRDAKCETSLWKFCSKMEPKHSHGHSIGASIFGQSYSYLILKLRTSPLYLKQQMVEYSTLILFLQIITLFSHKDHFDTQRSAGAEPAR